MLPGAIDLGIRIEGEAATRIRLESDACEGIVDRQYQLARIADAATELYVSACVLNRLDFLIRNSHDHDGALRLDLETGRYYLRTARRRIRQSLAALSDNDDEATTALANRVLK